MFPSNGFQVTGQSPYAMGGMPQSTGFLNTGGTGQMMMYPGMGQGMGQQQSPIVPASVFGGNVPTFNTGTASGFMPTNNTTSNLNNMFMPVNLSAPTTNNTFQPSFQNPQFNMPNITGNTLFSANNSGNRSNSTTSTTNNYNIFGPLITGNQGGTINSNFQPALNFGMGGGGGTPMMDQGMMQQQAMMQQAGMQQQAMQQQAMMQQVQQQQAMFQQSQQMAAAQMQQDMMMQQQASMQQQAFMQQAAEQQMVGQAVSEMVGNMMNMMMLMFQERFRGGSQANQKAACADPTHNHGRLQQV